jgi:hypothetical protein
MGEPARKIDTIDVRPDFTQADADALNQRFEGIGTSEMLKTLFDERQLGEVAVVSSFGTESAVLLHLVAAVDPTIPVTFVDTLKMFPETLEHSYGKSEPLLARFYAGNSTLMDKIRLLSGKPPISVSRAIWLLLKF